jgi:hypothetical protein
MTIMRIMMRGAEDDFIAMQTANGMEAAGATVFSITPNGQRTYPGALAPHTRFIVWAKVGNDEMIDMVDRAIGKELGE